MKGICVVCNKPATTLCSGCIEGLDVDGQLTLVYYCSKGCQKSHWKVHKADCKDANHRKLLYRAGDILQAVFYEFRDVTIYLPIAKLEKTEDGKTHLWEAYREDETKKGRSHEGLKLEGDVKKAVLSFMSCDQPLIYMHQLVKKVLSGRSSISCTLVPRYSLIFYRHLLDDGRARNLYQR